MSLRKARIAIAAAIFGMLATASPAMAVVPQFVAGHYLMTLNITSDTTCTNVAVTGIPSAWIFAYTGPSQPSTQMRTYANAVTPGQNGSASTNETDMFAFRFPTTPPAGSAKWLGNMRVTIVTNTNANSNGPQTVQGVAPFEFTFNFIDGNSFTGTFSFPSVDSNNLPCEVFSQMTAVRLGG